MLFQPYFLKNFLDIISSIEFNENNKLLAFLNILSMCLLSFCSSICFNQSWYRIQRLAQEIRTLIIMSVFYKTLYLNSYTATLTSTGQKINLINGDVYKIFYAILTFHFLWIAPIILIISLILLYPYLNYYIYGGIIIMLIITPLQIYLANQIGYKKKIMSNYTDLRIKIMNEILQGIRLIKFYVWEKPFKKNFII